MAQKFEQVSIWSNFDHLLEEAEKHFFASDFEKALNYWNDYASITGTPTWAKTHSDLNQLINSFKSLNSDDPQNLFDEWLKLRLQLNEGKVNSYAFEMMSKLMAKNYLHKKQTVSYDLATGIFCFIEGKLDNAKANLKVAVNHQPASLLTRLFLSKIYFAENDEKKGSALLSQAMFLGGNEILSDDIVPEKIRNLYGRLKSLHGKGEIGVWLVPFEAWFRNWIVLLEDNEFFQVMQQKERSERILQVKYYTSEKYRHFVRCLFIAEYVRQYLPKERGIIWEQEAYMEKLDNQLFQRYRKKRKPVA